MYRVSFIFRLNAFLVSVCTKGFAYLLCWPRKRGLGFLVCTRRFSFHEFYNFLLFNFLILIFFTHDIYPHARPLPTTYDPRHLATLKKICQKQQSVSFPFSCCTHGISRASLAWTQTDPWNSKDNLHDIKQSMFPFSYIEHSNFSTQSTIGTSQARTRMLELQLDITFCTLSLVCNHLEEYNNPKYHWPLPCLVGKQCKHFYVPSNLLFDRP